MTLYFPQITHKATFGIYLYCCHKVHVENMKRNTVKSIVSFITGMNIDYDIVLPMKVPTCTFSTVRFPTEMKNGYT